MQLPKILLMLFLAWRFCACAAAQPTLEELEEVGAQEKERLECHTVALRHAGERSDAECEGQLWEECEAVKSINKELSAALTECDG